MATKKAQYMVDNGSGYDVYHFETDEDMITDVKQSQLANGYRKLPGGLIIQWGRFNVPAGEYNGYTGAIATLPLTFPNEILNVSGTLSHSVTDEKYIISDLSIAADTTNNTQIGFRYKHTGNFLAGGVQINYIAIGR